MIADEPTESVAAGPCAAEEDEYTNAGAVTLEVAAEDSAERLVVAIKPLVLSADCKLADSCALLCATLLTYDASKPPAADEVASDAYVNC